MAMEMQLKPQQKMLQKLQMSPQMYQTIEILHIPLIELRERIEEELLKNPLLEEVEQRVSLEPEFPEQGEMIIEGSVEDIQQRKLEDTKEILNAQEEEYSDYRPSRSTVSDSEEDPKSAAMQNTAAPSCSLFEHIMQQARLMDLPLPLFTVIHVLASSLDRRGYLISDHRELVEHLKHRLQNEELEPEFAPLLDASVEDIDESLRILRTLDPAGIGASNVIECLLLQLDRMEGEHEIERQIIKHHLNLIAANKLPEIASILNISLERVNHAVNVIKKNLDPAPGVAFDSEPTHYVQADVIIKEIHGELEVSLSKNMLPRVRINNRLLQRLNRQEMTKENKEFIEGNRESAKWLLSAIKHRESTLLRVAKAVAVAQKDFFLKGRYHLKPLLMKDMADQLGVDVSIISRAVNKKHVDCPQGIIPLRELFTSGYSNDLGATISDETVKEELKRIVESEDKSKPLSDAAIEKRLKARNIPISRRTITKYRKELKIPNTRLRKQF